jgi:Family of unknown function (DUF6444)
LIFASQQPWYEELAALVAVQARVIAELRAEVAELKRQLGRNSTNSGQPSSKDSIAATARRRADLSSRERSKDLTPGGQAGAVVYGPNLNAAAVLPGSGVTSPWSGPRCW